jgi:HPt (histidine-containing phosphotransfer) domain-containing protein
MLGTEARPATLDFSDLLARVDGDRELLCELFTLFKEDFPPLLAAVEEAVSLGDYPRVARPAHTLAGMLANLSMVAAQAASVELECAAAEGSSCRVLKALSMLRDKVQEVLPEVDSYLAQGQL